MPETSNEKIQKVGRNIQEKAALVWSVADDLVGAFKPHEYGLVVLPMAVIKRFHDCLLPTHEQVLAQYEKVKKLAVRDGFLRRASGYQFYNTSPFTFKTLVALLNGVAKLKDKGRMAIIQNGSSLFTGDAGSGQSEIRRYLIENDWLDAIVQLIDVSSLDRGILVARVALTGSVHKGRIHNGSSAGNEVFCLQLGGKTVEEFLCSIRFCQCVSESPASLKGQEDVLPTAKLEQWPYNS